MKPHIFRERGMWWVNRHGRAAGRLPSQGVSGRDSFREACQLAQLAAIHEGLWRR